MWWGGGGGGGGSGRGVAAGLFVRYFSRERAVNVRKINPKVPYPEASTIAQSLYQVIKQNGPLSVSNTWIQAKEAGVSGLNSKTHLKIMLKWMRGRNMLKLFCNHVGSSKKFLHCTLPEDPEVTALRNSPENKPQAQRQAKRRTKKKK